MIVGDVIEPVGASALPYKARILIVDDHPLFRLGIAQLINTQDDLEICGEAESAQHALEAIRRLDPDLVVVDISLKGANGLELMKSIRAERPKLPMLVASMHDEALYALRALRAGARGYVMKEEALDQVMSAVRKVLAGEMYVSRALADQLIYKVVSGSEPASVVEKLTDRELEILRLIGRGKSTRQIAQELHLSVKTVESHRLHIKEKLDFRTAMEMVRFAIEWVTHRPGE